MFEIVLAILLLFITGLRSLKTWEALNHSLRCKIMVVLWHLERVFWIVAYSGLLLLHPNNQAFDPFASFLLIYIVLYAV